MTSAFGPLHVIRRLLGAAAGLLLMLVPAVAHAQCPQAIPDPDAPPQPVNSRPGGEELLPENGHLSNATYTSDFFGFSLNLPLAAWAHMIMLPLMPSRQHALLALAYEEGTRHGTLTIAAIDPHAGMEVLSLEDQKKRIRDWAANGHNTYGGFARPEIPDYMLHSGRFSYSLRHKNDNYTAIFSTRIRNYNVKVLVTSNERAFIDKAREDVDQTHFYCTQGDGILSTTEGKTIKPVGELYEGPTVPTARADAAIKDQPALKGIPAGGVSSGVYRNPSLGVQYDLPKGWEVLSADDNAEPPRDAIGAREHDFLHACSKTLLRTASPRAGENSQLLPQETIVLRALDPTCLSMRTPASITDKRTAAEVGSSLEVLSEFGEISSHELVSISDHLFAVFHGSIGARAAGEELANRMSQSIYLTRYNKTLLVWSLIAPTQTELNAMPSTRIAFDGSAPFELRPTVTAKNQ
jgi:hypothetical protein